MKDCDDMGKRNFYDSVIMDEKKFDENERDWRDGKCERGGRDLSEFTPSYLS